VDEAVKLLLPDVPAQTALLNGFAHVPPFESVLSVIVVVEPTEDGAGLFLGQHRRRFIGRAVNVLGGPQQRDSVGPVFGEQLFGCADALQGWP